MTVGFRCMAIFASLLLFSLPQTYAQTFYGEPNSNFQHSASLSKIFQKWEVYRLDAPALQIAAKNHTNIQYSLGDHSWNLDLTPSHITSPDYTLQVIGPDGKREILHPEDVAFQGYETSSGGRVRLTITDNFIYGFVEEPADVFYVEPLWYYEPAADPDLFVVYGDKAVIPNTDALCLVREVENKQQELTHSEQPADAPETISACYELELAIASDRSMYNKYGSSVVNVQNHNIGVLNAVQTNYTGQFNNDIQFVIVTQIVITGTDPWSNTTDAGDLLDEFVAWGNAGNFGVSYDLGEMWTNRNFNGGTVGIAYVGAVCTSMRYHCLQDFTSSAQQLRCMTTHEIGHNLDCNHDPENGSSCPPSFIMCPFVSTTNTWSNASRNKVNSYMPFLIATGCLSPCAGVTPPTAGFTWSPNPACQNQTVQFTDQSTGTISSRSWTFQGGTPATSTQTNPGVIWTTAGTFNVTLTVNGPGGPSSTTQQVTILPKPTANFTFTINGNTVTFTNTSVNADTYLWNMGNIFTTTEENPVFTFPTSGTYNVTLTATNSCGTSTKTISVKTAPTADFTGSPSSGCTPLSVHFLNQSTGTLITSYNWQFPGGTPATSTSASPTILYNTEGVFDVSLTVTNSAGSSTIVKEAYVVTQATPMAGFTSVVNGLNVQFTNTSTGAASYSWDFGDGTSSTETSPSHNYTSNAIYTVTLTATSTCGSKTFTRTIQAEGGPVANFSANTTSGCGPLTVSFVNQSSENAETYAWEFPGGTPSSSSVANPTVVYNTPGTYSVTLTAGNSAGTASFTRQSFITVSGAPIASFNSNTSGFVATFNNTTSNASSYIWNFGDGSSASTDANPVHTYTSDGVYTVVLTATNSCGTVSFTQTVTIVTAPTAGFNTASASGCAPFTVQFNNQSSSNAASYQWSFPGGMPAASTDSNPVIVYTTPGNYSATLIAINAAGADTMVQNNIVSINGGPTSAFGATASGFVATFNNNSVNATSYSWNFGDGSNASTQPSPSHTYSSDGTYTVVLTATNACGVNTSMQTVTIITPPTASFSAGQASGCAPFMVQFGNQSSSNATTFQWSFPGGTPSSSTDAAPVVVYGTPGTYSVTLIAGNAAGNDTLLQSNLLLVSNAPTTGFSSSSNNLIASFTNTSVNATSYTWNFGDGSPSSSAANPSHTYTEDGFYMVTLMATNSCGTTVMTQTITIISPPTAQFESSQTSGCGPMTVQFDNQSSSNATSYQWQFPGGVPATSTLANPMVVYNAPGTYSATLTASNAAGNNTFSQTNYITVLPLPLVHFTEAINGLNADFTNTSQNSQSFFWNFGEPENAGNNSSTLANPSHTYLHDGTYTVTLTVTNNCGAASFSQIITIATPPTAGFSSSANNICAPASIHFQNESSENAITYAWVFENGQPATSNAKDPVVVWNQPGVYTVAMTASNPTGSNTTTSTVTVVGVPTAGFNAETAGISVILENTTVGATSYHWDFGDPDSGDANTSTLLSPEHTFATVGTYTVTLIAENACGPDTISSNILIEGDAPISAFQVGDLSVLCAPATIQFKDISEGAPDSWLWEFPGGEPATSTEQFPVVTYAEPGTYSVTLTSSNIYGSNTVTNETALVVGSAPTALFEVTITDGVVNLNNQSTDADAYFWQLGDGDTSTVAAPEHNYAVSGMYDIVLMAMNDCGVDTFTQSVSLIITGATDPAAWDIFRVFPNPNYGRFTLEMKGRPQDLVEFVLFNTLGQQLTLETADFRSGTLIYDFDYKYLPAAMYTLRVRAGNESRFVKIAVQR